ncbi:outer membrane beta-barrel protein [Alteromonas genovensis]|uniref:Outer membrane beta-barrel protein n=1 Tax=Alteromonas genovensis TaxID=471225 RepID=A0A6N9TFG0_9ALTE|nr:outer membrane beta-barrel protein [Alteromonas genovensis]NDW14269.1 outer membrane beta-barrel protein [Alteromonas genovensis]
MKQYLWIAGALVAGALVCFKAEAAPENYGLVSVGYTDFEFDGGSDREVAYSVAYGHKIHRQWYAEAGYLNLFDYSDDGAEAEGEALYLAVLGKASSTTGELFYKLGVARVDVAATIPCGTETASASCSFDNGIAAGLIGLGFDYYVSQNSMVRFEYTYIGGEDSFSTNMLSLGFRYNFN